MEAVRQTQKRYCTRAMTISILAALVLMLAGHKGIGKGLVLGTLFSVFNFILMGEALPLRLQRERGMTFALTLLSVCLRYILLATPVIVALKWGEIDLMAAVLGIFMVQIMILGDQIYQSFKH